MSETEEQQQQSVPPEPERPAGPGFQAGGVNTENLKDYRELRRSVTDRKIAGVAGGLGRHLNIDPVILRVMFVVLCFFGGSGFVLYVAAWLLVPEDGKERGIIETSPGTRNALLIGALVVGALLLLGDAGWGGPGLTPWPLIPLAIVVGLVLWVTRNNQNTGRGGAANGPAVHGWVGGQPGPEAGQPAGSAEPGVAPAHQQAPYQYAQYAPYTPYTPAPRPDRGPLLFGFTLALVAVALGALGLYQALVDPVDAAAYPALALAVVGIMLVVGSFFGRPGGLVLLGLVAMVTLAAFALVDPRFEGDRVLDEAPTTASAVRDEYTVPSGQIVLDLSDVRDVAALDGRTIDLSAQAGELIVILPDDVTADISADIAYGGEIELPGRNTDGFDISADQRVTVGDPEADIELNLDLKFGHIEVRNP